MLTSEEFKLFRNLIYKESGIFLHESKLEFLEYRLLKRMKVTRAASPYWYYRHLLEHQEKELSPLLDSLTINETSFFRNMPQFDLLRETVLPALAARKARAAMPRVRIWSAGCSTGEEPYSIAMTLLDRLGLPDGWEMQVCASDLNMAVLASARRGCYPAAKVRETVAAAYLQRYFTTTGEHFEVREVVRRLVVFDFHNLKHENGMRDMDVIFCRNVLIYFDEEEQRRVIDKFYHSLAPGGFLFLGHSESLQGVDTRFEFVFEHKGAAYRRPEGGTSS
ncbi:MAG: CheR family methyltransferase [Candidatus Methylomirabilia bacterium]